MRQDRVRRVVAACGVAPHADARNIYVRVLRGHLPEDGNVIVAAGAEAKVVVRDGAERARSQRRAATIHKYSDEAEFSDRLLLVAMGTPIFDNCDLEDAAELANRIGRWEFLLTASPLAVPGGTGSPLNPRATF